MTKKLVAGEILLKRFSTNAIDTYSGDRNEAFLDVRAATPKLKLSNGTTPSGVDASGVQAGQAYVAAPTVVSPTDGLTDVSLSPVITGSAFNGVTAEQTADTHTATFWEIATDTGFVNIVHATGRDEVNLTSLDLAQEGVTLTGSTTYYIRLSYKGTNESVSAWGPTSSFTTEEDAIAQGKSTGSQVVSTDLAFHLAAGEFENSSGLAVNGDATRLAVGETSYTLGSFSSAGRVHLYKDTGAGLTFDRYLDHPNPTANENFGSDMAYTSDDSRLLVSCHGSQSVLGRVYVYDVTGAIPILIQTIYEPELSNGSNSVFGDCISLTPDGSVLVVSAGNHSAPGTSYRGRFYIFRYDGSNYQLEETIEGLLDSEGMGRTVCISGDGTVIITDYIKRQSGANSGNGHLRTYKYNGSAWSMVGTEITPSSHSSVYIGSFGLHLSHDGTVMAVGDRYFGTSGGAAWVFNGPGDGNFAEIARLGPEIDDMGKTTSIFLGSMISINPAGTRIAVSAPLWGVSGQVAGAFVLYDLVNGTWTRIARYLGPNLNGIVHSADGTTVVSVGNSTTTTDAIVKVT